MPLIEWILGSLLAFYCLALVALYLGFRGLCRQLPASPSTLSKAELPSVSVIVAARNEERNISRLISCLTSQDYPREKLEIILVDDRSEDGTWNAIEAAAKQYAFVKALRITDTLPDFAPKKRAIDTAIRSAQGEMILLTDADCTPPPKWVQTMVAYYQDGVAGVISYSPYRFDSPIPPLVRGMLALDYFSIFAVAAASSGLGWALTASGTNLSYRKQIFLDIGGFEPIKGIISGDDDLFLHEVIRKKLGTFTFALDPQAFVPAAAPTSWRQFWNQRIRYASKGRHYGGAKTAGLLAVYVFNLCIVLGLASGIAGISNVFWFSLALWAGKSLAEFIFLFHAARRFNETALLTFFLPTAILHPFYITVFGFLGLFAKFRWKD